MFKSRTESLLCYKEELQISKEENYKERSLPLLPEWRAAKGVMFMFVAISGVKSQE